MTLPRLLGTMTDTFMMGSSRTGLAFAAGLLEGHGAGDLKCHLQSESTSWKEPSYRVTFTSTTG